MPMVEIREHQIGDRSIDSFLDVQKAIYKEDPHFIAPLRFDAKAKLQAKKNPFFNRGEAIFFTAHKGEKAVGRISAHLDHLHLKRYQDQTGFFGFFDCIDDDEVAEALVDKAASWLRKKGMTRMRGPFSFTVWDEAGVLIEGFDAPPSLLMNHNGPWMDRLAHHAGLTKAKDLYAWKYNVGKIPERALKAWRDVKDMPEVRLRSVRKKDLQHELAIITDIFNDAWEQNWGFVPVTAEESRKSAEDLALLIDENLAYIAEVHGKPAAMCITLPNLNEVISDFNGSLNPINLAKLIWRLKVKRPKSARLMMLGIKKEFRNVRRYGGLSHALYVEIAKRGQALGYEWGELSWTLEDNAPVNLGIRSMGGQIYKKYRIYEKEL